MKIIGQNLPAVALFLIMVLGFTSTSTNAMKLQFQSSVQKEQKGEVDKYATVFSSGPSTPTEPPHDGSSSSGPGGPPHANGILQRKGLDVLSQSSMKEDEKREVNYKHMFSSGPSTPTEPPHDGSRRSGPGRPPHAKGILQRKGLDVQSQSSRKEEEKGKVNYMQVFVSGPSTPTEPPHDGSPRSGPGGPPDANGMLRRKGLDVQSQSSRKEEEKGKVNYMHVFVSGPSTPTEPPHNGRGPPPLPSSRVGVLNMQPKKIPPPSRPARKHNVIPPTPS